MGFAGLIQVMADYESQKLSPLIPKTTKAAEYHQQVFLPKVADRLQQLSRVPLSVFVCGPSSEADPLAKKKLDIINAFREKDYDAYTGEEVVKELKTRDTKAGRPVRTDNVYEREVARSSELVIMLRVSYGSVAEFHEFFSVPEIANHLYVFVDEEHYDSYSTVGALSMHEKMYGKVLRYKSPDDIEKCSLVGRSLEIAEMHRAAKWLSEQGML